MTKCISPLGVDIIAHQTNSPWRIFIVLIAVSLAASAGVSPAVAQSAAQAHEVDRIAANQQIVRRFLLAIPARDPDGLRSVLAPHARMLLVVAGVYSPELHAFAEGTQWDREQIIAARLPFQRDLKGPFSLRIVSLTAEADAVAVEAIGQGVRASTDRQYCQHYSWHFHLLDRRITEVRLYEDTFHHWDIWNSPDPKSAARPPYHASYDVSCVSDGQIPESTPDAGDADLIAANKEVVRRYLMSVPTKDAEIAAATWVPDGTWSFAVGGGYAPALHAFKGAPRWDRAAMIEMQQRSHGDFKEPMTLDIYSMIGEGDRVSAEAIGILVRENGRAYRQHYSMHFVLRGGKLLEGHVYQDTLHQYDLALPHPIQAPVAAPISR